MSKMTDDKASEQWWLKPIQALNTSEWEALCDGCGKCCLEKLEDDEGAGMLFSIIACDHLRTKCGNSADGAETKTVTCACYTKRLSRKTDCIKITPALLAESAHWLPGTCAYRLRWEGKPLPDWHPLISGNKESVRQAGHSVADRAMLNDGRQTLTNAEKLENLLANDEVDWEPLVIRDWS
ncbi:YcgN family cysteine cluster protein [Allohahella marinimesophila]|uniref:Uncharacterized protein n=1 Tax=Allohahella marinimesophila TaxID=1054972 RepID=A0ABP7NJ16_9GAMM